jgi:hypothetical protein
MKKFSFAFLAIAESTGEDATDAYNRLMKQIELADIKIYQQRNVMKLTEDDIDGQR